MVKIGNTGQRKDSDTEEKILEAAGKIFLLRGLDGARMQEIADEAGINKALLHYYFRSKDNLYKVVVKRIVGDFFPALFKVFDEEASLKEKIYSFFDLYLSFLLENPLVPQFLIAEMVRQPDKIGEMFSAIEMQAFKKLDAILEQSILHGEIKPIATEQFLLNMVSLSVFPIIAKPIIISIMNMSDEDYKKVIEDRKIQAAEFFINAIS